MTSNSNSSINVFRALPTTTNHFATTAAVTLRLGDALRRRFLLRSSLKKLSILSGVPHLEDVCHERALQLAGFNCLQWSFNALSGTLSSLSFFNGDKSGSNSKNLGKPQSRTPRRDFFDGRQWTNILLAANVLVYIAQYASDGNLMFLGAKINSLISKGQLWRLVTSSFLHANIGHLLVNCYSLNSIGPTVENICGPKRYLTIYISSAIASASMSYWFCKAPAVGASGAIFGLVGSFAMFVLRHRGMVKGTENDLKHIAQVIAINMTIGLLSQGIDNWGHAGGLLGGVAVSWLLGPSWELQSVARDGRRNFEDKAPIFYLMRRRPK
ncbi:RHOMBOID-like protein 10, chloroplastic isoform X1 [Salvia hispanica]|uniref:RHOMBOID-like protein 10, chloroplastic isoform X1 n=1 Tax=Salvia hispanica TaxID=49212 RepID=UPI002008F9D1|nr:RHOMBOID-like protein 10, chloroplastic isoform X1 [Salvia hispanica]XP_047947650.1 RHOMBOID-like protein 10, chloroplastic isoform X1 [Salvia hispanica]XP_047947651.1 RHOMBOID-like protein 10, chloroplastic isoform X1 [Salvia hispanica]